MPDELSSPDDNLEPATEATEHPTVRRLREVVVVLVRHGQSQWNAEGRYQGQLGPGLTELGHEQARRTADFLTSNFGPFDRVLASDLPRVQETLQPWGEKTGTVPEIDTRWREIDSGAWSGRFPDEVKKLFPDEVAAFDRGEDIPRGGGETFAQLRARVWQAMTDLATRPVDDDASDETTALVFTHGGCIHMAAAETLGLPPGGHRWLRSPDNCSVTVFRHTVDHAGRLTSSTLIDYNVDTA
jgi:broad specificity phosphatase PhoE